MKFTLLISDSPIQVSYKFAMLIFKMTLVIQHYVQFALLFVHTVGSRISEESVFPDYLFQNEIHLDWNEENEQYLRKFCVIKMRFEEFQTKV